MSDIASILKWHLEQTRWGIPKEHVVAALAEIERLRADARAYANVALSEENDALIEENKRLRAALVEIRDHWAKAQAARPPYYVQGETVRGEPRVYWVVERATDKCVSAYTTDHRQAERWLRARLKALEGK